MSGSVVRRSPTHRGTVIAAAALTPRMRRVTVRSEALVDATLCPAQDIELLLREPSGRRVKRRYTIRRARLATGELDLDVLMHGDAPGSRWGATAQVGDEIEFQGPRGKLELRPAPAHLLVGDESALPAIAAICEALPQTERADALIEVGGPADELPVAAAVRWVHRGDRPAGGADLLAAAIEAHLGGVAPAPGTRAYLMGESRSMVALRARLEELGVAHDSIFVKGYWNIGRPDRLANRPPD